MDINDGAALHIRFSVDRGGTFTDVFAEVIDSQITTSRTYVCAVQKIERHSERASNPDAFRIKLSLGKDSFNRTKAINFAVTRALLL